MTLPAALAELRQAKEHLDRARQMIAAALRELVQVEALLRSALGNVRDQSVYAVPARTKQLLTEAAQGANQTTQKVEHWIAKIQGTAGPGN